MWEKRIRHDGLKAYRVVRGQTQSDVELKARLQESIWEERWQKKVHISSQRLNQFTAKGIALERTKELESYRDELSNILTSVLDDTGPFDWEKLKDKSQFCVKAPDEPVLGPAPPPPPDPNDERYAPELFFPGFKFWEILIPSIRRKKKAEFAKKLDELRQLAEQKYEKDKSDWTTHTNEILRTNEIKRIAHLDKVQSWKRSKQTFYAEQTAANTAVDSLRSRYLANDESSIKSYFDEVLAHSIYPDCFPREHLLEYIASTKTLVLDFELPNTSALPTVKEVKFVATRSELQEVTLSDAWIRKAYDEVLYQISLRTIHELFTFDETDVLRSVVFNGWVRSIDRATGSEVHACVMSLEAGKDEFLAINLRQVDPKLCFKKLKGVSASKLIELSPVKPLVLLNREDKRFVEGYAVVEGIDERTNLAAMDWLDFENLIREVFEKEFSKGGGEVKITQASRDGGVDAIAFDPDPIRGGKIVIQAKRYTNTVGVSAVRDLYGTVHNEGANKGILVTTSDYGPDAYAFAKDKPLTLLSGGELLYLLAQHGHSAKIDIPEAKRIAAENER
jgi:restriction system protein